MLGSWVSTDLTKRSLSLALSTKSDASLRAHGISLCTALLQLSSLQPIRESLKKALSQLQSGSADHLSAALSDQRSQLRALLPKGIGQTLLNLSRESDPGILGNSIARLAGEYRTQGDHRSAIAFYQLAAQLLKGQEGWENRLAQVHDWLETLNGHGTFTKQLQLRLEGLPQAVSSPMLAGMVAGGLAHPLAARWFTHLLRGRLPALAQVGLVHTGAMLADATAFTSVERGLQAYQGQPLAQSYQKAWVHALWMMTHLRAAGALGRSLAHNPLSRNVLRIAGHKVENTIFTLLPHATEMGGLYLSQSMGPSVGIGERSLFTGLDTVFAWGHFRIAGGILGMSPRYLRLRQQLSQQASIDLRQGTQNTYHRLRQWLCSNTSARPGHRPAWALANAGAETLSSSPPQSAHSLATHLAKQASIAHMSSQSGRGASHNPDTVIEILRQNRDRLGPDGDTQIAKLIADFKTQEVLRAHASKDPQNSKPTKTLYYLDGLPGVGKTTQIKHLQDMLGFGYLSMKYFSIDRGISAENSAEHRTIRRTLQAETGQLTQDDIDFLDAIAEADHKHIILEKFPRSPIEAKALVQRAQQEGWQLHVIHLGFREDPVGNSVRRQLARGPREGEPLTPEYAVNRVLRNFARHTSGRWTLAELGVPVHNIEASLSEGEILAHIRQAVGLGFEELPWHRQTLQELAQVADNLGIEAWVSGGHLYRPFFNNRYGPPQNPTDIDVTVANQADVQLLLTALQVRYPTKHWSVFCHRTHIEKKYGITTANLQEARRYTPFTHKAGLVRWHQGRLEIYFVPGAEAAVRDGVISINPHLLNRIPPDQHEALIDNTLDKLPRILGNYPGLRLETTLAQRFENRYGVAHRSQDTTQDWAKLKQRVIGNEKKLPNSTAHARRPLDAEELVLANRILDAHRAIDFTPEAQPRPPRADLPEPLETLRRAQEKQKAGITLTPAEQDLLKAKTIPPPQDYDSWFHYMVLETPDAPFQNWVSNQAFHHKPIGGADPYLASVLSLEIFQQLRNLQTGQQSSMHQGAHLKTHLANTMIALRTDALINRHQDAMNPQALRELRASMRMAMLWHDTGKIADVHTAGRHSVISARLWEKSTKKPRWVSGDQIDLVAWMIQGHDIFGRFSRGLAEKKGHPRWNHQVDPNRPSSYPGALDAQAVRTHIARSGLPYDLSIEVISEVYRADVASVPPLRPLLPVINPIGKLVGMRPPPAPRDRYDYPTDNSNS